MRQPKGPEGRSGLNQFVEQGRVGVEAAKRVRRYWSERALPSSVIEEELVARVPELAPLIVAWNSTARLLSGMRLTTIGLVLANARIEGVGLQFMDGEELLAEPRERSF